MNKIVFGIGIVVLVVGIALFYYGYSTIQNMSATYGIYLSDVLLEISSLREQWDLAQMLQPLGLGLLVFGAMILAYSIFAKK